MNEENSFELLKLHHKEHHEFDEELLDKLIEVQKIIEMQGTPYPRCTVKAQNIITSMIVDIRKKGGTA